MNGGAHSFTVTVSGRANPYDKIEFGAHFSDRRGYRGDAHSGGADSPLPVDTPTVTRGLI